MVNKNKERMERAELKYKQRKSGRGTTGKEDFQHAMRVAYLAPGKYRAASVKHPLGGKNQKRATYKANPKLAKGIWQSRVGYDLGTGMNRLKKDPAFRKYKRWKPSIGVNTDWI